MLLPEPPPLPDAVSRELGDLVWVMVGGLASALQQAGVAAVLLETSSRPRCIFAAGFSVANALLAAEGDPAHFERGWEHLRARRFVATAALGSYRLLAAADGFLDELSTKLATLSGPATSGHRGSTSANGNRPERSAVRVAGEDGFVALPPDPIAPGWRSAVKSALRRSRTSAPLVAAAIREAASVAPHILVLGVDRPLQTHPDVDAARRLAHSAGAEVDFVTTPPEDAPGLLDYLLPGSGAPERLVTGGRAAAEAWLRARAVENPSSDPIRQRQPAVAGNAPLDGNQADGGGVDSAARGAWRRDLSEASSWEK
jgi:hypothetical protein